MSKFKCDFITNSSSSSFLIVGKHVYLDEIDLSNGNYLFVGKELCDGMDTIEIDQDILKYLKSNVRHSYYDKYYLNGTPIQLIKTYLEKNEEYDDFKVTLGELKNYLRDDEEFELISLERDYHGSSDVRDLIDRYGDD